MSRRQRPGPRGGVGSTAAGPSLRPLSAFVIFCGDPLLQKHYLEQPQEEKRAVPVHAAVPQGGPAARHQKQRAPSDHRLRYLAISGRRKRKGGRGKERERDHAEFEPKSPTELQKTGRERTCVVLPAQLVRTVRGTRRAPSHRSPRAHAVLPSQFPLSLLTASFLNVALTADVGFVVFLHREHIQEETLATRFTVSVSVKLCTVFTESIHFFLL